ncbi:INGRESSION PROTEIN FIC1 [Salix purpurea]|uniref:INGRESSION PROTEIN FIC1 n=1 Tax=Salix purpurea TaxID=77065 RepID=A0A9Q0TJM1_SALPP|nr:INGRESSION PROTEIN FIC1 [Salix purpurea]
MPKGSFLSCGVERDHNSSVKKKAKHTMDSTSLELKVISCRDHNSSVKKKAKHTMGSISLELKVISCRDLKVFNFFQKLSVYVAVSIFIDEPRKNEKHRQKRAVDFLSRLLKKNDKQLQRLQRKKTRLDDEEQKNEQQLLLQRQKTLVDREGGSNPEWNHMMQFDLNTTSLPGHGDHHLFFKFELRSEGAIFGNKAIGEVLVPFKDLIEGFNGSVRIVNYHVRNSDEESIGVLSFSYEVKEKIKRIDTPKVDWAPGFRSPSPKKLVLHP